MNVVTKKGKSFTDIKEVKQEVDYIVLYRDIGMPVKIHDTVYLVYND